MDCLRCKKPIDEHQAGRETDACVAEVVMGFPKGKYVPQPAGGVAPIDAEIVILDSDDSFAVAWGTRVVGGTRPFFIDGYLYGGDGMGRRWSPSTDIGDAWAVVEKAHERGWYFEIRTGDIADVSFSVNIRDSRSGTWDYHGGSSDGWVTECAQAPAAPLAICLAALKAVANT